MHLTVENTAIVVDSTADFPHAPHRFPNWRVVPLYVHFGGESFRDYVDLSPAEFYARLRSEETLPTTSQPTPGDFAAIYEGLSKYDRILSLHIAGNFSGTVESARRAAEEVDPARIRVIDTGTASVAVAMLGLGIQRRLVGGTSDEDVDRLVESYRSDAHLIFSVETLEYLARGGRIGRAAAWAGQLLNVKPILTIEHGEVLPVKRVRGNRRAFMEFVEVFRSTTHAAAGLRVGIAHADAPERAEALKGLIRRERPRAELELATTLGPVVGTHAGPGTVGLFWFQDEH